MDAINVKDFSKCLTCKEMPYLTSTILATQTVVICPRGDCPNKSEKMIRR